MTQSRVNRWKREDGMWLDTVVSGTIWGDGECSTAVGREILSTNTKSRTRREATKATTQELVPSREANRVL
jgi:hypothetical protein